jgi:dihydroorotase-like cyclic amidohydrolase
VDLDATHMVVGGEQQSGAEYSPWEDWEMKGSVRSTFLRGSRIFDVLEGFSGPGGQFLSRRYSGARALEEV